jgi:Raf kinase inhibitor-like YbhB/YbcL family protein
VKVAKKANDYIKQRWISGRLFVIAVFNLFFIVSSISGKEGMVMAKLSINSPAFQHNGDIPVRYTCDGDDINPPLAFENVPQGTQSLVLIIDDPDAPMGTWVHWVVWNIDPGIGEIKEDSVPAGASQGMNDFRKLEYGGPCPPSGTHRYFFKLYALDSTLDLASKAKKADVEKAMKGHVIEESQIIGLYRRK